MKEQGTYIKKCAELKAMREEYRRTVILGDENKSLYLRIKELDKELKNIDKALGMMYRPIGNYNKSIEGSKTKSWLKVFLNAWGL